MHSLQKGKQHAKLLTVANYVVGLWMFLATFCGKFSEVLNISCNKMLKWNSFILGLALS